MIACPGCGAGLRFDIPSQNMKCDYCGELHDPDLFRTTASKENRVSYYDAYAFDCPSCGAELITTDKTDATGFCPYCDTPITVGQKFCTGCGHRLDV